MTSPGEATEAVSHPAEVVRLAATARGVLTELRGGDLGETARSRAYAVYEQSLTQLSALLSDGLRTELSQLVGEHPAGRGDELGCPGSGRDAPSTGQLRVAEAQLAGWLDGLLQTMDASLAAGALSAQRELEAEEPKGAAGEALARDTSYL